MVTKQDKSTVATHAVLPRTKVPTNSLKNCHQLIQYCAYLALMMRKLKLSLLRLPLAHSPSHHARAPRRSAVDPIRVITDVGVRVAEGNVAHSLVGEEGDSSQCGGFLSALRRGGTGKDSSEFPGQSLGPMRQLGQT